MTGNDADAADATQEALIAVTRGLPGFDGRSRFSTWVYRLAVNASIDELRRRARRPAVSLDTMTADRGSPDRGSRESGRDPAAVAFAASAPGPGAARTGAPPFADPESVAERVDVDAAVRSLPPDFRAAVVLRDLCGLDYAEIADVLNVPPGTVRSRIARGRGLLSERLGPAGGEP
jgi:RNA polymerase sigma-70 factor (ECF subfamily)